MKSFKNALFRIIGLQRTKHYLESASMFLAEVETPIRNRYWVESIQFEDSNGERDERHYHLKFVGEHIYKVCDFASKEEAMNFFDNMTFTEEGALEVRRLKGIPREIYDKDVSVNYRVEERLYDNGYAALYTFKLLNRAISYCEGGVVEYHTPNEEVMEKLCERSLKFHQENNE